MAETKLNKAIFNLTVDNHELVKLAYDTYLANSRSSHAKTLRRGEVRGGGKKPWRQKGTGRARFGSTRNPIWRHGGVAFGRTGEENFTKKLNKSAKLQAVRQALSMQHKNKKIDIAPDFAPRHGKVKEWYAYCDTLSDRRPLPKGCSILVIVPEKTDLILRATNNIPELKVIRPTYLNVFDILNADKILISEKSLPIMEDWLC
jgi:large subunit ribosomal protein L4